MKWPTAALGDLFTIARGGSPRPIADYLTDGDDGVNWVSISDATDSAKYIRSTKRRIKPSGISRSRVVQPGDFLLTNSMSFGRPYIMATSGCIHDGWLALSPKSARTDPDYLYQILSSADTYRKFERLAAGATVKNLNIDLVKGVEIPLPPLRDQRRIAAILDQADELRRKRREAIKIVGELSRATFLSAFGNPFDRELGRDVLPLEDLMTRITYGFTSPMKHYEQGIPIITAKNVRDGFVDYENCHYASHEQFDDLTDKSKPKYGDILITKDGTIGRYAIFDRRSAVCINQSVALLQPDSTKVLSSYVAAYLGSSPVQSRIEGMKKGGGIQHLQITELAKFPVTLPKMSKQSEFETRISAISCQLQRMVAHAVILEQVFASLQHRAFNGEL